MSSLFATPPPTKYEPLGDTYLVAITRIIYEAWNYLPSYPYAPSLSIADYSDEDMLSARLKMIIMYFLSHKSFEWFTDELFETVTRDEKLPNYDYTNYDFMPDLTFRIRNKTLHYDEHYAWFIECKIIDATRDINNYTKSGISRFADGYYAWKMPHAMMIAFVHNNKSLPEELNNFFDHSTASAASTYKSTIRVVPYDLFNQGINLYLSAHCRNFTLLDGSLPGEIEVLHLWLKINPHWLSMLATSEI